MTLKNKMSDEATLLEILNTTGTIQRYTETSKDTWGKPVVSWSNVYTDVPARIDDIIRQNRRVEIIVDMKTVVIRFIIYIPSNATYSITEKDRIVIGSTTYEILQVSDAAGEGHHQELFVREVKT